MFHVNITVRGFVLAAVLLAVLHGQVLGQPPSSATAPLPKATDNKWDAKATSSPSILGSDTRPIDFDSALRLAGVRNPELMIARERLTEAAAQRQFAAAQLLPKYQRGHKLRRPHRQSSAIDGRDADRSSTVFVPWRRGRRDWRRNGRNSRRRMESTVIGTDLQQPHRSTSCC